MTHRRQRQFATIPAVRPGRGNLDLLSLFADPEPWMEEGICAQADPDAWFPEKGGSTESAKRICMGCPVRDECLRYALDHDERFGVWGGLSERERRKAKVTGERPEIRSPKPRPVDEELDVRAVVVQAMAAAGATRAWIAETLGIGMGSVGRALNRKMDVAS